MAAGPACRDHAGENHFHARTGVLQRLVKWQKRGLIYAPTGELWWAKSHAFSPTAQNLGDDTIRIFFASLDERQFGRIGFVDVDAADPSRIKYETKEPVLTLGELGTFDDSGVNPSCVITIDGQTHLYYIGWQRCERVPHMLFVGLAVQTAERSSFTRVSLAPILDRTDQEPFSRSALFVLRDRKPFQGWYWNCTDWSIEENWIHYNTVIRYAESDDGIRWRSIGPPCITPTGQEDYTVGRPWVIKEAGIYKMWYSIRSRAKISYRLGYAESDDGIAWTRRDDQVGIDVSESGWDSEMLCFPCVVDASDRRYLFYNGNKHGSTGFGYAVLEN
jgi:hypothetical protein